jgi:RND family efflux transporter MFP subunit
VEKREKMSEAQHPEPKKRAEQAQDQHGHGGVPAALSGRTAVVLVVLVLIVAAVLAVTGILPRIHARGKLADQTNSLALPDVLVQTPEQGKPEQEIALPGNITAYIDSPIYARTNGYLKKWYFDIGAHVKKGQLLAEIESPEVDQQLAQAKADLATAEATAGLAKTNAARYQDLLKADAVSQQDTDTFVTQQNSTSTQVKSAIANVQRLQELVRFEKIYAPFDGVVTARNIDIGQLIDAGASRELFHLSQLNTLRVYVNVPQVYSGACIPGIAADLTFAEHPGQTFQGKLVRTANAIDPNTRTLLIEIDVKNPRGVLYPGAYAQVHMKAANAAPAMIVPVSALIFRSEGLRVGRVIHTEQGDTAQLVPIIIGQDDGRVVQVVNGLAAGDRVITNPPDSLIDGEKLHVIEPQAGTGTQEGQNQLAASGQSGKAKPLKNGGGAKK